MFSNHDGGGVSADFLSQVTEDMRKWKVTSLYLFMVILANDQRGLVLATCESMARRMWTDEYLPPVHLYPQGKIVRVEMLGKVVALEDKPHIVRSAEEGFCLGVQIMANKGGAK